MRARAWRIDALFSRVAVNQQELDVQRLLARLGIWGPLSILLERSPWGERVLHCPHTSSSHAFLAYSICWPVHVPSFCLCFSPTLTDISLHIADKRSKFAPVLVLCCRNALMGTKKGANRCGCFDKHNVGYIM